MPEEFEVPLEQTQEHIAEFHKEHYGGEASEKKEAAGEEPGEEKHGWARYIAVVTAILAVVAAIGALQSGLLVNEALLQKNEQIGKLTQASDQWNYYQAEGLKSLIYKTAAQSLPPGSEAAKADLQQSKHYAGKQKELQQDALGKEQDAEKSSGRAERFLQRHHLSAVAVSLCQIAIALSAVAALMRRRRVWYFGLAAGIGGAVVLLYNILRYGFLN